MCLWFIYIIVSFHFEKIKKRINILDFFCFLMFSQIKIFEFLKSFFQNQFGVSAIFGALLLFGICVLFLSAFLIYAVPAWELQQESEENDSLYLSVIQFSNETEIISQKAGFSPFQSVFLLPPSNATVLTDTDGGFLFLADLSIPSESESYLLSESSVSGYYVLSRGSVIFSNSYHQLPDQFYFVGPSSLLLCQNEGASFVKSPSVRFVRESDGRILLTLSGQIFKSESSPIFGEKSVVRYRETKTVMIHDFVSDVEIRYVPSPSSYLQTYSIFYENRDIASEMWLSDLAGRLAIDFPEIEAVYTDELSSLIISSAVPIEIDICITEFEIELDGS
jgi:hypothetical protein